MKRILLLASCLFLAIASYSQTDIYPTVGNDSVPPYSYRAVLDYPLKRTFYKEFTANSSQGLYIGVSSSTSGIYFLVWKKDAPSEYSISHYFPKVLPGQGAIETIYIPSDGVYCIAAVTNSDMEQHANISIHGSISYSGTVYVNNCYIEYPISANRVADSFTWTPSTGCDPVLAALSGGLGGHVVASCDNANLGGNFNWGKNAVIRGAQPEPISGMLVFNRNTSPSTSYPVDVYIGCPSLNNVTAHGLPDANLNDVFVSSNRNSAKYNAFSWSAGIWTHFLNINSDFSDANAYSSVSEYLDALYSSLGFTKITSSNCFSMIPMIALWGIDDGIEPVYKNVSLSGRANGHPHGFAWESKLGTRERVFHLNNQLCQQEYGQVLCTYGRNVSQINIEPSTCIVIENTPITATEYGIITEQVNYISAADKQNFGSNYNLAKSSLSQSMSNDYSEMDDNPYYLNLVSMCIDNPNIIYLAYQRLANGDDFAVKLIGDIASFSNYLIIDDIMAYNSLHKQSANGSMIVRTPYCNACKYVKRVLGSDANANATYSDESMFNVYSDNGKVTVELELDRDSNVDIYISTLGQSPAVLTSKSYVLEKGSQSVSFDTANKGIHTVTCVINGCVYGKKINL